MTLGATIDPTAGVVALPVPAGGSLVVRGAWRFRAQNTWIDACHEGREGQGDGQAPGALDLAGGGLAVRAYSASEHSCRLEATGQSAPACTAAGVEGPCIALRLRSVAHEQAIPVSYEELVQGLSGGLAYEVVSAGVVAAPSETAFYARTPVQVGGGALLLAALAAGAWAMTRKKGRASDALGEVRRVATRVRGRLAGAQPVLARMAPRIEALVETLKAQAARGAKDAEIGARVAALRARKAEIESLEQYAGSKEAAREHADARAHVEEQLRGAEAALARVQTFDARVRRVREYLLALDARMDEAERTGGENAAANAEEEERLRAAFDEVESAFEGAREADAVVARARV